MLALLASLALQFPTSTADYAIGATPNSFFGGIDTASCTGVVPDGSTWVGWLVVDESPFGSTQGSIQLQHLSPTGALTFPVEGLFAASLPAPGTVSEPSAFDLAAGPDGRAYFVHQPDGQALLLSVASTQGTIATFTVDGDLASPTRAEVVVSNAGPVVVAWQRDGGVRLAFFDPSDGSTVAGPWNSPPAPLINGPRAVALPDGDAAIFWHDDAAFDLWMQRFAPDGSPRYPDPGLLVASSVGPSGLPDRGEVQALGSDVVVLYADKRVQRIAADGTFLFGSDFEVIGPSGAIVPGSAIDIDPATGEIFVVGVYATFEGGFFGITVDNLAVQRISAGGQLQWGPEGLIVEKVPYQNGSFVQSLPQVDHPEIHAIGDGRSQVIWVEGTEALGPHQHRMRLVAADGTPIGADSIELTAVPSQDGLITQSESVRGSLGQRILVYSANLVNGWDLYAKSITANGVLGPAAGAVAVAGPGNTLDLESEVGPIGASFDATLDLTVSGHSFGVLFATVGGGQSTLANQTLLIDLAQPELLGLPVAPGPQAAWSIPIPAGAALVGASLRVQAAGVDAVVPLGLSNGLDVYLGL